MIITTLVMNVIKTMTKKKEFILFISPLYKYIFTPLSLSFFLRFRFKLCC